MEQRLEPRARLRLLPGPSGSLTVRRIRAETQSRPAPTARKATPSTTPTESGPPPLMRVADEDHQAERDQQNEKARTEPR